MSNVVEEMLLVRPDYDSPNLGQVTRLSLLKSVVSVLKRIQDYPLITSGFFGEGFGELSVEIGFGAEVNRHGDFAGGVRARGTTVQNVASDEDGRPVDRLAPVFTIVGGHEEVADGGTPGDERFNCGLWKAS